MNGANLSYRSFIKPGFLFVLALLLHLVGYFPARVEQWYSTGLYPAIGNTLRLITRWIPFSIGDILYSWVIIWALYKLIRFGIRCWKKELGRADIVPIFLRLCSRILTIYIVFRLLWGLNYDRLGIAYQLKLAKPAYDSAQLNRLTNRLIDSMNAARMRLPADTALPVMQVDSIYRYAFRAYANISYQYPFLSYANRSVKPSLFTRLADHIGFTGYYNPFSGEAQIRSDIPSLVQPFVVCHEMAHQLGYASESEANFIGFITAMGAESDFFKYSALIELVNYAQREQIYVYLNDGDTTSLKQTLQQNRLRMDTLVRKDRKTIREFFDHRRTNISPAMNQLYDHYLKLNNQSAGIRSYDEVIGWVLVNLEI